MSDYPRQSNAIKLLRHKVIMEQPSPIANIIATDETSRVIYFQNGQKTVITKDRLKGILDKRLTYEAGMKDIRQRMNDYHDGGSGVEGMRRNSAEVRMRAPKNKSISRYNMTGHQAGFRDARSYH